MLNQKCFALISPCGWFGLALNLLQNNSRCQTVYDDSAASARPQNLTDSCQRHRETIQRKKIAELNQLYYVGWEPVPVAIGEKKECIRRNLVARHSI
jgi:hypothetical protein